MATKECVYFTHCYGPIPLYLASLRHAWDFECPIHPNETDCRAK